MATGTNKPVGSDDFRDLRANAINLDDAVNGDANEWTDRLGRQRVTMKAVEEAVPDAIAARDAAQLAQGQAELARDASFVTGPKYATEAAGRAAVADGVNFLVQGAGEVAAYEYRRTNVSTSVLIASYPSSIAIANRDTRVALNAEQPNLFTAGEILFTDPSKFTNTAAVTPSIRVGVGAWKVTAAAGAAQSAIRTFARSLLGSATTFSASVLVQELEPGVSTSSCFIEISQVNASAGVIAGTAVTVPLAAAVGLATPKKCEFPALAIHADAVNIQMRFFIYATGMATTRSLWMRDLLFCAGNLPIFTQPAPAALIAAASREARIRTQLERPNLFSAGEVAITDSTQWQGTATIAPSEKNSVAAWKITAPAGGSNSKYRYFQRSLIGTATTVSASLLVPELEPGVVASNCFVDLRQFDAGGAEIGGTAVTMPIAAAAGLSIPKQIEFSAVAVHANTAQFQIRVFLYATGMAAARSVWVRDLLFCAGPNPLFINPPSVSAGGGSSILYVGGAGASDLNLGTSSSPFASPGAAIARAAALGVTADIRFQGEGDYSAAGVSMAGLDRLVMRTETDAKVRLIGAAPLAGISKTGGYTKVYQAALAAAPPGKYVWQHDVEDESTVITQALRHSLHRGMRTRLPHTRIKQVASIAAIDAASAPSWFYSAGVLYFSVSGGGDATGQSIYVPSTTSLPFSGGNGRGSLLVEGITSLYSSRNFRATNLARAEVISCRSYGSAVDGFSQDDTRIAILERCVSGGPNNDGFNQHSYLNTLSQIYSSVMHRDNWAHDTGDDGDSIHEFCEGSYWGGLYEYCGDRGIATAAGAHTSHYNAIARFCGQESDADNGAGFCVTNPVADSGLGTSMQLHNCISIGNKINFSAVSDANSTMQVYGGASVDAVDFDFEARANTRMELLGDVRVISGVAQRNLTSSGGVIVVRGGVAAVGV